MQFSFHIDGRRIEVRECLIVQEAREQWQERLGENPSEYSKCTYLPLLLYMLLVLRAFDVVLWMSLCLSAQYSNDVWNPILILEPKYNNTNALQHAMWYSVAR